MSYDNAEGKERDWRQMAERVARLEAATDNLCRWQASQNGTIREVDAKVDRLLFWMMATVAGAALNLLGLILTSVLRR